LKFQAAAFNNEEEKTQKSLVSSNR